MYVPLDERVDWGGIKKNNFFQEQLKLSISIISVNASNSFTAAFPRMDLSYKDQHNLNISLEFLS